MLTMNTENIHLVAKKAIVAQYGEGDSIFGALRNYVVKTVTQRILDSVTNGQGEVIRLDNEDKERLLQKVTNIIWNNFSGGDSAFAVATTIFEELDI